MQKYTKNTTFVYCSDKMWKIIAIFARIIAEYFYQMNIPKSYFISLLVVAVVVLCVCFNNTLATMLIDIDKHLMLAFTFREHTWFDMFWYQYSRLATWLPLVLVLVVTMWIYNPNSIKKKILLFVAIALLVVVLDQISSGLIKPMVERFRPSHDESIAHALQYVNDYRGGKYGFVSGHATNIVGIVTWLCYMFRSRMARILFVVFAATMCYSRIYLSVHFPGDILCGSLLGFFVARFGMALLDKYGISFATNRQPWYVLGVYIATIIVLLFV